MHAFIQRQDTIPRIETILPTIPCGFGSAKSPAVCPDPQSLEGKNIQGTYATQQYEYIKIEALKCMGHDRCAPIEEINEIIRQGSVECQVYLTSQNFEADLYHQTGKGDVIRDITWRWYAMPLYEQKVELYMRARQISHEERYVGSPPLPEREVFLMSYDRVEVVHQPMQPEFDADMLSWYVRLGNDMDLEEVSYWMPSILDLFGLWGAMASFLTSLSFGIVATAYNRWRFTKKFEKSTKETRRKAKLRAKLAMRLSRSDDSTSKAYRFVQSKFDDQIIDSDIRLFDANHFDDHGRLRITPEELRFPATAFGELRRIAIMKHMQNTRSATIISEWYLRTLLKRDKIKNIDRRKALVRELSYTLMRNSEKDLMKQHREEIEKEEETLRSTKGLLKLQRAYTSSFGSLKAVNQIASPKNDSMNDSTATRRWKMAGSAILSNKGIIAPNGNESSTSSNNDGWSPGLLKEEEEHDLKSSVDFRASTVVDRPIDDEPVQGVAVEPEDESVLGEDQDEQEAAFDPSTYDSGDQTKFPKGDGHFS